MEIARADIIALGREQGLEVGIRKRNPAIFEKALTIGVFSPEQVLFLDDYGGSILAAQALRIRSILLDVDGAKTVADLNAIMSL